MAVGDLFPDHEDLHVRGEEEVPGGDVSHASDYKNWADKTNSAFGTAYAVIQTFFLDISLLRQWAVGGPTEVIEKGEPDHRSAKSYATSAKSLCDHFEGGPVDHKGDPLSVEPGPVYSDSAESIMNDAVSDADSTIAHRSTGESYYNLQDGIFQQGFDRLKAIADTRKILDNIIPQDVARYYPLISDLNDTGGGGALSFSRSSDAMKKNIDANGRVSYEKVTSNTPRFEENGLLIEPAIKNYFTTTETNCEGWDIYSGSKVAYSGSEVYPDGSAIGKVFKIGSDSNIRIRRSWYAPDEPGISLSELSEALCFSVFILNLNTEATLSTGSVQIQVSDSANNRHNKITQIVNIDFQNVSSTFGTPATERRQDLDANTPYVEKLDDRLYRVWCFTRQGSPVYDDAASYPTFCELTISITGAEDNGLAIWCPQLETNKSDSWESWNGRMKVCGPTSPCPDFVRSQDDLTIPGNCLPSIACEKIPNNVKLLSLRYKLLHNGPYYPAPSGVGASGNMDFITPKYYLSSTFNYDGVRADNRAQPYKKPYILYVNARNKRFLELDGDSDNYSEYNGLWSSDKDEVYTPFAINAMGHVRDIMIFSGE